jgi:putative DNA methylase
MTLPYRKKLIEVALPLDAINKASAREKSIRHGHPSTLHLWWARRPLAAARAVIFAQMVDDPSAHPDLFPTEKAQEKERQRLFRIIEDLVLWENTTNEKVLQQARDEIWQSWRYTCAVNAGHPRAKELFDRHKLPAFHDPFAGGGSIPLEAQRLGLEAYASDLNPVAVLINKAMIEIPPRFAGRPPVNPKARRDRQLFNKEWKGAQGLAEDVLYYGQWMRDEAKKRIGHLYPKVEVTAAMAKERPDLKKYVGQELTVIAWLWARTVKSPNPAFAQVDVPLVSSFILSPMVGKEAYIEPIVEGGGYRFIVKEGNPKEGKAAKNGTKLAHGANFRCVMSGSPMPQDYIRGEFQAKRNGERLMAIVAEGDRGRVYLPPTSEHEAVARTAQPAWRPQQEMNQETSNLVSGRGYGITHWNEIFTTRQLVALATFSDLVHEVRDQLKRDALAASVPDNGKPHAAGGSGPLAYAGAVATYLAFLLSKLADKGSTICTWNAGPVSSRSASGRSAPVATVRGTFARQALPMTWDFAEVNFFSESVGGIETVLRTLAVPLQMFVASSHPGTSAQADAAAKMPGTRSAVISTDPPYYDNIGYADLSDFFYIWLREALKPVFPELFATLVVPKAEELVATPHRHGSKKKAEAFFLDGMTQAMQRIAEQAHPAFPVTIYYAFKQSETESEGEGGTVSTGWDTFLEAVIRAGLAISGTWPMRTERGARSIGIGTNALASSIVLVCRRRAANALTATRREFVTALKAELPAALAHLQRGNIAPVDLAQAAIGPGMAVYTSYAKVLDAQGKPLSVREALALINQTLDEALAEQEGDFDADSRWALAWFEHTGFTEGEYGVAETLSTAKNTSVAGLAEAGIVKSSRGKVRLMRPDELPADWDPSTDPRLTAWETVHQLVRALEKGGESAAAALVAKLATKAESARELCYRLYTLCERKKRAAEALSYNGLVQSWPEITRLAQEGGKPRQQQTTFIESDEE